MMWPATTSWSPLRRKLRAFWRMGTDQQRLIWEAALMLGLARLIVLMVPFRFLVRCLRRMPDSATCDPRLLRAVGDAVATAARNVPWNALCLPQALAAKAMLARRGCGSAFYIGTRFDSRGRISVHAWLVAGGEVVVGAAGMQSMVPLARFG